MAISASGACRLPTCLCARPCWLRMNTSHSGHSLLMMRILQGTGRRRGPENQDRSGASGRLAARLLLGVGGQPVAHPGAGFVSLLARGQAFAVAGAVALDDRIELVPVDLAEIVVAALGVPFQVGVGHGQAQVFGL